MKPIKNHFMKRNLLIKLSTFLLFICVASTGAFAQDKNTCLGIARNIERDLNQLDPGEQINQKLFDYCDGLRNFISAGTSDSWYTIQRYLKQIEGAVSDAKKGQCTASDCSRVKSNVNKIKNELD